MIPESDALRSREFDIQINKKQACKFSENIKIESKQQNKVYSWQYQQSKNENAGRERFVIDNNPKKEKKREKKTKRAGEASLLKKQYFSDCSSSLTELIQWTLRCNFFITS